MTKSRSKISEFLKRDRDHLKLTNKMFWNNFLVLEVEFLYSAEYFMVSMK